MSKWVLAALIMFMCACSSYETKVKSVVSKGSDFYQYPSHVAQMVIGSNGMLFVVHCADVSKVTLDLEAAYHQLDGGAKEKLVLDTSGEARGHHDAWKFAEEKNWSLHNGKVSDDPGKEGLHTYYLPYQVEGVHYIAQVTTRITHEKVPRNGVPGGFP